MFCFSGFKERSSLMLCMIYNNLIKYIFVKWKSLSHVQLFVIPWTVARQAPLSMEFSRQEYWSGLPFPSPGDLSGPGIKNGSAALQADSLPSGPPGKPIPLQAKVKQLPLSLPDTFRIWKLLNTLFMAT